MRWSWWLLACLPAVAWSFVRPQGARQLTRPALLLTAQAPQNSAAPPLEGESAAYRWRQDDDWVWVELPLPRAATNDDVHLAVHPDSLQVALEPRVAPEVEPITAGFMGRVDPSTVKYGVAQTADGGHALRLKLGKDAAEGTCELWWGLLRGEAPGPTRRFRFHGANYNWTQTATDLTVSIIVPSDTTTKGVRFDFSPDGWRWQLSFDSFPSFGTSTGRFWGKVDTTESTWLLLRNDEDAPATFELCLAKKPARHGQSAWWPALSVDEHDDVSEQRALAADPLWAWRHKPLGGPTG